MSAFYDQASLVVVPSGYKAGKVYAQKPLTTDGQLSFTRSTDGTRVNSAGLIETVSSNVPRLDYLGSTCPKLQLEPQRSNLLLQSSALDSGTWTKDGGSVSANSTTSPDGTANADLFTEDTSTGNHRVYQNPISTSANQPVTFSVFAKYNGRQYIYLRTDDTGNLKTAVFDIQNGTAGTVTSGATSNIENYGGGWYRCTITVAATANALTCEGLLGFLNGPSFANAGYTGNGTAGAYLWGFQAEANASYATSYIPTLGAAVTRGADFAQKSSISSLFGSTEGTFFCELTYTNVNSIPIFLASSVSSSFNQATFLQFAGDKITYNVYSGGTQQAGITSSSNFTEGQNVKIAIAYKQDDFVIYVNGVAEGTANSGSISNSLAGIQIGRWDDAGATFQYFGKVAQALLIPTRLSNAELAALTA